MGCKNTTIPKDLSTPQHLNEDFKNILYYASLAPSGHNTQMWQVTVAENEWQILLDSSRLLKEVDPRGRESLISIGTFIENMRLAFNAYGYKTDVLINNKAIDISKYPLIAKIRFTKDKSLPSDKQILQTMKKRHTDKRNYPQTILEPGLILSLEKEYGGKLLYFPKGSKEFEYIKNNSYEANEKQMFSKQKAEELARWLRFSDKEALAAADGLPAEQLGIKGIKKFFYYLVMDREKAKSKKFAAQGLKMTSEKLENNAGFFLILGGNNTGDFVRAGMTMQSFWLKATEAGISLHPMSQILEEEGYKENLEKELNSKLPIQMVFRAGRMKDYGSNNKIRRPIKEFVFFPAVD
ncbi:hypothetical protein Dip510_000735 [Elusimicrobium posterum]|uniref:Acg family FMN-binding oxidoreductase n=1 Tax=Elusimicrobium posterum TaxID=3116653 RepID=UPI003C74FAD7